jgi:hypothetical protein
MAGVTMKLTPESFHNLFVCFHPDQGNTPFSSDTVFCATIAAEKMTPFFYPARNNWRVQIPASETETNEPVFQTKEG